MTRPSPPTQSGCSPPAGRRQHPICSLQPFQGPRPALPSPAIPCSPRLGTLCSGTGRQGYPSLPGRQRLWKPPGSCFQPCGPRDACGPLGRLNRRWGGARREPVPCRPALLVRRACPPHPHHGLLSRQMRHFINCILNTCFKLVKAVSSFRSLPFSPFAVAAFHCWGRSGDRTGVAEHPRPSTPREGDPWLSAPRGLRTTTPPAAFPWGLPV